LYLTGQLCPAGIPGRAAKYVFDFNQEKEILEKHAGSVQQIVF